MEQILHRLGLSDKIQLFKQKEITFKSLEYFTGPHSTIETREMIKQETGLSTD